MSLALAVLILAIRWQTSSTSWPFVHGLTYAMLWMVPAWSVISAAVGAPVQRKVRYIVGLLIFVLLFSLVAFWFGIQDLLARGTVAEETGTALMVDAFRLILVASPFVALIVFAGKKPSVFWARDE